MNSLATTRLATTPLDRLAVISVDLETTGLRTQTDRIVQIGALVPSPHKSQLSTLVNPGIPISKESTAIHHISDEDVHDAPKFPVAFSELRALMKDRIVIGYNIGFDLAVLAAESKRFGVEWQPQSALCVRQLASIVLGRDSMLMMGSLEALAEQFNISSDDRHTALGDARMAYQLFIALLDSLHSKGIVTLADAWRAVSTLDDQRLATTNAGWVDVAAPHLQASTELALARIDPFPYRHKIAEMMLSSPLILPPDYTVYQAARLMQDKKKDCAFVGDDASSIHGIVSERDIVRCMAMPIDEVSRARDIHLHTIMSSPVITVTENDFMHIALGRIGRYDIRHLGVVDLAGHLCGYISSRELNRVRLTQAMVIGDELSAARTSSDMATALKSLPMLASSLTSEGISGYDIAAVISGEYRAALMRAAHLATDQMTADEGPPPADFCVLMLGSGGRGESLLAPDQDHALIYADVDEDKSNQARNWFLQLGTRISSLLDAAGIPFCSGGVMSSQPKWCRSSAEWASQILRWIEAGRTEDMLSVDIFFDFHPVFGEQFLADDISTLIAENAPEQPEFLKLLAGNVTSHHGGSTLFGGLKTVNGRFDIKLHMLLPLVEFMRVLSISRGFLAKSSAERAAQLFTSKTVPPEVMQLSDDLKFCIKLLLRQQINDISAGKPATSKIELTLLSAHEKQIIKSVQGRISRLDQLLTDCLFSQ